MVNFIFGLNNWLMFLQNQKNKKQIKLILYSTNFKSTQIVTKTIILLYMKRMKLRMKNAKVLKLRVNFLHL